MGALLLPTRFAQQPTEYAQLSSGGLVRKPTAAFIPSLTGLRILGDGKRDLYGKSTGTGFAPAMAIYGTSAKGTTSSTDTIRLNVLANQLDTVWEKPSAQVTVMLVFRRTGTPAGTSPIFSNQCPNNSPFCAWGLFDQSNDFAAFEVSPGGVNQHLNSNTLIPVNKMVVLIGRYDGTKMDLFQNGVKVGSQAASGTITYPSASDRGPSVGNFYNFTGGNRSAMMEAYGGALWDVGISDAEITALSQNPWQMFSGPPRRLWNAGVAAASVTAALTWTEASDTMSIAGLLTNRASAAWSDADDTMTAAATVTDRAALAWSEHGETASLTVAVQEPAQSSITATIAWTEASETATTVVRLTNRATIAIVEQDDTWLLEVVADSLETPAAAASAVNIYTIMRNEPVNVSARLGGAVNLIGNLI